MGYRKKKKRGIKDRAIENDEYKVRCFRRKKIQNF